MAKINNVNVEAMASFAAQVEQDPAAAKKLKSVTGQWNFAEGAPQFRAEVEYPGGAHAVETDFAPSWAAKDFAPTPFLIACTGSPPASPAPSWQSQRPRA